MDLFKTKRIVIRLFQDSDFESLKKMMSDNEVMQYTGFKKPQPDERILELLSQWKNEGENQLGVWAAEEIETRNFIGWFMLKTTISSDPELGFMLEKNQWRKGFATEIAKGFLNYAFSKMDIKRVLASVNITNTASLKVLKKLVMRQCEEQKNDTAIIYFEIFSSK